MNTLVLAWAHIRHHLARSLVLVLALAAILFVPAATRTVLTAAETRLTARADATPLIVGAAGSRLDLILNGLYFAEADPPLITQAALDAVWDSGLAAGIPLHIRYQAQGAPIVGTSLDYLDLRGLAVAEGRPFALLGEALLGAEVARRLGLGPGDTLISAPETLFDIAGAYPLQMSVTGVLAPTGGPDDRAVLVDTRTAWVIAGIGHGHDDVVEGDARTVATQGGTAELSAAATTFTRITEDNVDSFHFHGDPATYPLSMVIAVPPDPRSATLLRGRYLDTPEQIVVPGEAMRDLLATIFRLGRLLAGVTAVVAAAAALAIGLALYLALRLRAPEIAIMRRIGAGRLAMARLMGTELLILLAAAAALAALGLLAVRTQAEPIALWLVAA